MKVPSDNQDQETRPAAEKAVPESSVAATSRVMRFDPAFRASVEAGLLTPLQAYSRGKRDAYAQGLVIRCGLARETAYAVADNQMTLAEARGAQPEHGQPIERFPGRNRRILWVAAIVLVGVAGGLHRMSSETAEPATVVEHRGGGVQIDESGRVTRVIAGSPQQVLSSFCNEIPSLEALGVMPSASAAVPIRIGVMRDSITPDPLLAIAIREDRHSGRWFAGDGRRPLVPGEAPPNASFAIRQVAP